MYPRDLTIKLKSAATQFPIVSLLGPRQAGKTTLAKETFPEYKYVSLEDLDNRAFAEDDPRNFLTTYSNGEGVIIDEIQHVPSLFSYLQTHVDTTQLVGKFVLTGSQNFLLNEKISQTLAGRVAIFTLWPLSIDELKRVDKLPRHYEALLFSGCYPRIYAQEMLATDWYPNYIRTYLERDVRQIQNIGDLRHFQTFMKLCAGRVGQMLNLSDLARDCGIAPNTAKAWISILEASYIIFLLSPHHANFNKRLIKSPKLYFCDTGLCCSLLGIESESQISSHYLRGGLFEALIISEMIKKRLNLGLVPNVYFWRDQVGHEIDCIYENGSKLTPIEIKSAKTIKQDFFSDLEYWCKLAGLDPESAVLIYGGDELQKRKHARVLGWQHTAEILSV